MSSPLQAFTSPDSSNISKPTSTPIGLYYIQPRHSNPHRYILHQAPTTFRAPIATQATKTTEDIPHPTTLVIPLNGEHCCLPETICRLLLVGITETTGMSSLTHCLSMPIIHFPLHSLDTLGLVTNQAIYHLITWTDLDYRTPPSTLPHLYGTHHHTISLFPHQNLAIVLYHLQYHQHLAIPPTPFPRRKKGKIKYSTSDPLTTGWAGTIQLTTLYPQLATSSQS